MKRFWWHDYNDSYLKLYNWDSYFISLGLLVDGQVNMAKGMVDHFIFEIKHYNKVRNHMGWLLKAQFNIREDPKWQSELLSMPISTPIPN